MFASIDIGTNSTLMIIGEPKSDGSVVLREDLISVTRLGKGVEETGYISEMAADRTINVLKNYLTICKKHEIQKFACVATETLRKAKNAKKFIQRVKREVGFDVKVIGGQKEAKLTYEASAHDFGFDIIVIDIGGGSTEIIHKQGPKTSEILNLISLNLGCVNLKEAFFHEFPPDGTEIEAARKKIDDILNAQVHLESIPKGQHLIATAGTATSLMAMHLEVEPYSGKMVHGKRLGLSDIDDMIEDISSMTLDELKTWPGLMPERADVILPGALILERTIRKLGFHETLISDRGVRWGVFYEEFIK